MKALRVLLAALMLTIPSLGVSDSYTRSQTQILMTGLSLTPAAGPGIQSYASSPIYVRGATYVLFYITCRKVAAAAPTLAVDMAPYDTLGAWLLNTSGNDQLIADNASSFTKANVLRGGQCITVYQQNAISHHIPITHNFLRLRIVTGGAAGDSVMGVTVRAIAFYGAETDFGGLRQATSPVQIVGTCTKNGLFTPSDTTAALPPITIGSQVYSGTLNTAYGFFTNGTDTATCYGVVTQKLGRNFVIFPNTANNADVSTPQMFTFFNN